MFDAPGNMFDDPVNTFQLVCAVALILLWGRWYISHSIRRKLDEMDNKLDQLLSRSR